MNNKGANSIKWFAIFGAFLLLSNCKSVGSYYKSTKPQYTFDTENASSKPKQEYSSSFKLPAILPLDFIWGINGHPIDIPSYRYPGSLDLQTGLLNELQLSQYRIKITLNDDGEVDFWKGDTERWKNTLVQCKKADIKVFPVILLRDFDFSMTPEKAYSIAKKQTSGFAKKYKEEIDTYALGNEMDLKLELKGKDGSKVEHYDRKKFDVWIAFLKGMSAGVRAEDPTAKLVINGAGRHRWGYYEYIKQQKVDYDIIGFHWYSEMGRIPEPYLSEKDGLDIMKLMYQQFDKPIWITEINQHWGVIDHPESHQAFWIDHFIDNLKGRDYVKAFFVYELFDQPHLDDGEGYENKKQAYFGLIDWIDPYTSYRYRPAAITYKYKIEEVKRGLAHYVTTLGEKLNLSQEAQNQILAKLKQNTSPQKIVEELFSNHNPKGLLNKNSNDIYLSLLKRKPTEKEEKYWAKQLKKNTSKLDMIIALVTSQEFYKNAIIVGYEKNSGDSFLREGVYKTLKQAD